MASEAWQMVGTIASTAGVTTFAIGGAKGILAGYRTYASPYTSLTETGKMLEKVRTRLQGLSPKRREEIEIATLGESFNGSRLEDLEQKLDDLLDMHDRLSKGIEKTTFTECHFPYSVFRAHLSKFEEHAKALLNDTLKTTVPCVDDLMYNPEISRRAMERSSSSKSTFNPENSRQATERRSSPKSTVNPQNPTQATERPSSSAESAFNPEISTRPMERPSSSKPALNPETLRWAMKGSSSSESTEGFVTARESFSDLDDIPLSPLSPGRMV